MDAHEGLLGFSGEELRFLEAAWRGGAAERAALRAALAAAADAASPLQDAILSLDPGDDPSGPGDDPSGPVEISPLGLLVAAAPLVILTIISSYLRLGLHGKLAVAAVRCTAQLWALGYILVPIFVANTWWLTASYAACMLLVAAAEAVSRPTQAYGGMLAEVLLAMGLACGATISFGLAAVVRVQPWYDAQYLIPMLGMLLGNSCSSVAVGLSAALEELSTGRDKVEALLALGASRLEATRDVVVRAARLAMMPLLNSMNVVGIVSIPGMMSGQILGGSRPAVAARYQILIYFLVAMASSASGVATIYGAVLTICDRKHRLRAEKLERRAWAARGAVAWLGAQAAAGAAATRAGAAAAGRRLRRVFWRQPPPRTRHRVSSYLQEASVAAGPSRDIETPLLPSPRE